MTSKKQGTGRNPIPRTPHENQENRLEANTSADSTQGGAPGSPPPQDLEPIPTFTPKGLTPLQWRVAHEYIIDLNGTQAYLRANPDVTVETARTEASKVLALPHVAREVQRLMDERAIRTGITADRVLVDLWNLATADPRELTELRIGCCRCCWGLYNQYQYTEVELDLAHDKHLREGKKKADAENRVFDPSANPFPEKGGGGFDKSKPPNPECPECAGEGDTRPVLHDTRYLSPGAAALYDGIAIKRGKFGEITVNVKTQDRMAAKQLVGRHLGMWNDKIKLGADEESPLFTLIREIQTAHNTLPIVHDDPERRTPGREVIDVTPRPASKWKASTPKE